MLFSSDGILTAMLCDVRRTFGPFCRLKSTLLAAGLILAATSVTAADVKLSRTGICHDTSSPSYTQTTRYTAFPSLESCIAAGGRLPKGASSHNLADGNDAESEAVAAG